MENRHSTNNNNEKLVVEYKNNWYDLTNFIRLHPGGVNILKHKSHQSIDSEFDNVIHSSAAKYLLKQYELKTEENSDVGMEHLVDWTKPMLPQISKLGDDYAKWINLPVDRPLRIFENDFLELISKWNSVLFTQLMIGICLWPFMEYVVHRYLFHINLHSMPSLRAFHFLIHGNHHKVPFDKHRLVFPPIPAALMASIVYLVLKLLHFCNFISHPKLIMSGLIIGYLCYDMTHYYIHFASPTSNYFYNLKRYHNQHHFVHHDKGFGISNTFWDVIFSTKVLLNKLKYQIKWE
ncbi:fatty acid 2-hydroxylase-like [Chironomus tepperi]|uniref:fatty acid 2-hydroxylase-like n=1 Tax=Chironomus tepperi TaxID=113505 RepID=UPI00391F2093